MCTKSVMGLVACLVMVLSLTAVAHTDMVSPNGGEVLTPGDTIEIVWTVVIQHGLQNWDLWYSTTGNSGPWIPIVSDLPAGDPTAGSLHSYLWVVPSALSDEVYFRVRMDNAATDYYGISDGDISISEALTADVASLSASAGGIQTLSFDAGAAHAFAPFIVLGSVAGSTPGTSTAPLGPWLIPLNFDFYFQHTLSLPGTAPLAGSVGNLDATGSATCTFTLPAGTSSAIVGYVIRHAAVVVSSTGTSVPLISNARSVSFTL